MHPTNPLSPKAVRLTGGFWKAKQDLVAEQVIPYQWKALNDEIPGAEPSHSIENFRIAAGLKKGEYAGMIFQDSDLGKWIEAAAYSLMQRPDPGLEALIDQVVEVVGQAQEPDGYLETYFSVKAPDKRWTDFAMGHEMYCGGHLIEGAAAYFEATGKRTFLEIMMRYADHLVKTFGSGPGQIVAYDGHPEIELALYKLYRATGQESYRDLARFFIDERGRHPNVLDSAKIISWTWEPTLWNGRDYYQDHLPVREQKAATGHAVRAMYLYTAMADQFRLDQDASLWPALEALWHNVTTRHMYVTGGLGSQATGERFTLEDDLPSDTAYAETCAAIGLAIWAWRMTLSDLDSRYADVLERVLYNGALSGISLDGKRYFYVNPLQVVPAVDEYRHDLHHVKTSRVEWFGCACCPPNIARTIASFGQYLVSSDQKGVWVHQYAEGTVTAPVASGQAVLEQKTGYPWDGTVVLTVKTVPGGSWNLGLRIPAWCEAPKLSLNGQPVSTGKRDRGYFILTREWKAGDIVEVVLPMEVRFLRSSSRLRETFGQVAVQRGPLLWCAEEADNGPGLHQLSLRTSGRVAVEPCPGLGSEALQLRVQGVRTELRSEEAYTTLRPRTEDVDVVLIPYHLWANRARGEMRVWLEESRAPALPLPDLP